MELAPEVGVMSLFKSVLTGHLQVFLYNKTPDLKSDMWGLGGW